MGKLCRIRLLRPKDARCCRGGVSEKELAVLTGKAALSSSSESEADFKKKKKQPTKKQRKKTSESS